MWAILRASVQLDAVDQLWPGRLLTRWWPPNQAGNNCDEHHFLVSSLVLIRLTAYMYDGRAVLVLRLNVDGRLCILRRYFLAGGQENAGTLAIGG
jgi:hypothetical protein